MVKPNVSGKPGDETTTEERLRALMVRYQNADPEAAEGLVMLLSPMLLRFLARPGFPPQYTQDLLQECWLRIHKSRHAYQPDAPVLPWVYSIARHTGQDGYRRRVRKEGREVPLEEFHQSAPLPDRTSHTGEELLHLVDGLPESSAR